MTNHITDPNSLSTLILDGTYQPIGFFSARAAIKHLITGKAKAYDRHGNLQNFSGWMMETNYHHEDNPYMNTAHQRVDVPTVMVITHFFGRHKKVRRGDNTSLRHLFKVYDGTCQYCFKKIKYSEATKDHVYPKSKGGSNGSENLVLACKKCNALKADVFPHYDVNGNIPKPKHITGINKLKMQTPKNRPEWDFFLYNK